MWSFAYIPHLLLSSTIPKKASFLIKCCAYHLHSKICKDQHKVNLIPDNFPNLPTPTFSHNSTKKKKDTFKNPHKDSFLSIK